MEKLMQELYELITKWEKKAESDTQFSNEIWKRITLKQCTRDLRDILSRERGGV